VNLFIKKIDNRLPQIFRKVFYLKGGEHMIKKISLVSGLFALSTFAAVSVAFAQTATPTNSPTPTTVTASVTPSPTTTVPSAAPATGRAQ